MSRISEDEKGGNGGHGKAGASGVADAARQVGEDLRKLGGQVRAAAKEKCEELGGQARQYFEEGRRTARGWEHDVESYIQEKPIKTILIAAGVGLLLGLLLKR